LSNNFIQRTFPLSENAANADVSHKNNKKHRQIAITNLKAKGG